LLSGTTHFGRNRRGSVIDVAVIPSTARAGGGGLWFASARLLVLDVCCTRALTSVHAGVHAGFWFCLICVGKPPIATFLIFQSRPSRTCRRTTARSASVRGRGRVRVAWLCFWWRGLPPWQRTVYDDDDDLDVVLLLLLLRPCLFEVVRAVCCSSLLPPPPRAPAHPLPALPSSGQFTDPAAIFVTDACTVA